MTNRLDFCIDSLHSTVVLLKAISSITPSSSVSSFTFYCSSIKSQRKRATSWRESSFTFYCSSIKSFRKDLLGCCAEDFTFYCSSIKSGRVTEEEQARIALHSTVVLLKVLALVVIVHRERTLHSTVVLLKG